MLRTRFIPPLVVLAAACTDPGADAAPGSDTGTAAGDVTGATSVADAGTDAGTSGAASTSATTTTDASSVTTTATEGGDTGMPDHDPNPLFADLEPGHVLDLGPFECTPPAGEEGCIGVTDYSGMAFDGYGHRVLAFGGGHATTMNDAVIALELGGTPTWTSLYEPTPCEDMEPSNLDASLGAWLSGASGPYPRPLSAHTYDFVAYAPARNELVLLGRAFTGGYCSGVGNDVGGPIAHYDLAAGTWSFSEDEASRGFVEGLAGAEFDPVSGLFVSFGGAGVALYDPETRTVVGAVAQLSGVDMSGLGYANHLTYFPPTDTFYYFMRGAPVQVYALQLDRTDLAGSSLSLVATNGPSPDHQEPGYDYDPVHQRIGGAVLNDAFHSFDPTTGTWTATTVQGGSPGTQAFHTLVYDGIDDVFLFVSDGASGGHTWAYRQG